MMTEKMKDNRKHEAKNKMRGMVKKEKTNERPTDQLH